MWSLNSGITSFATANKVRGEEKLPEAIIRGLLGKLARMLFNCSVLITRMCAIYSLTQNKNLSSHAIAV